MTPLPLHRLTPAAQSQVLRALHQARRGRPLYVTLGFGRLVLHAWFGSHSLVPDTLWQDGKTPKGRVSPWPRIYYLGTAGSFPGGLTEDGVDHEAISWAYEQDEDWWERDGWRERGVIDSP